MSRTFVLSDNMAARVELITDPEDDLIRAFCVGCCASVFEEGFDTLGDAEQEAGLHADRCRRCADPDCRTQGRHDAGHRCRKDS